MIVNGSEVDFSPATITAEPEEPGTEEERQSLLLALYEANEAAVRVLESMDRNHELLQECIREVRQTRDGLRGTTAT